MSLIDAFKGTCILMEKRRIPDGEGGWIQTWEEGPEFEAAVVMDTTLNARVAEKEGMTAVYTVTTEKGFPLEFHDVFKRAKDGKVFRVTSDSSDKETPDVASFQFHQVNAEEWQLT